MGLLVIQTCPQLKGNHAKAHRRAFTLIDILVSLAVISLLISLMLPSIAKVRESARKVVCSSSMRQIGLGMHLYAEDNKDMLPSSVFLDDNGGRTAQPWLPHLMDTARTAPGEFEDRVWGQWDGLGLLFYKGYVNAAAVYYCPSHEGLNPLEAYQDQWAFGATGEIITNYQYRGIGPQGQRLLYNIDASAAMVTDSLRTVDDINHDRGLNVLAAGLSVNWFEDTENQILQSVLSRTDDDADSANEAWVLFDGGHPDSP